MILKYAASFFQQTMMHQTLKEEVQTPEEEEKALLQFHWQAAPSLTSERFCLLLFSFLRFSDKFPVRDL